MYVYLFAIKTSGKRGQLEEQETTVPVIKTIVQLYPNKIIIYFETAKKMVCSRENSLPLY